MKNITKNKTLEKLAAKLPAWIKIQNYYMISISLRLANAIDNKYKSRKEFANKIGKKESEISKLLSGTHNFTIKTIAKMEAELGEQIILMPQDTEEGNKEAHNFGNTNRKEKENDVQVIPLNSLRRPYHKAVKDSESIYQVNEVSENDFSTISEDENIAMLG